MKEETKNKVCKKIRKGDHVLVTSGNYRGQYGLVRTCMGDKIIVEGINVRTRHVKKQGDRPGQKITIEKPIHISNVRLCTKEAKPLKVKIRFDDQGARQLYYKRDGNDVLHRPIKKPAS